MGKEVASADLEVEIVPEEGLAFWVQEGRVSHAYRLLIILLMPKEINGKHRMGNVISLLPAVTDEEYEGHMIPALIEAMQLLWATAHTSRPEVLGKISEALLSYTFSSLETLDAIRRSGYFDDNKLPEDIARAIDNLAADYAEAKGGEDSRELANKLRTRLATKTDWKLKW